MIKEKISKFRGFEIADMSFSKQIQKCSECVPETCNKRDCTLQLYSFGEDRIIAGGLCPKGNTGQQKGKTPNYISIYNNILDNHLNKITKPLESIVNEPKPCILIPRSLTFLNELGVFYASLYNSLGFDIVVSPKSNDIISHLGKEKAHSESCYPVILAHGHASLLKNHLRPGIDKMLLVNAISYDDEKLKFCPYVASAGYVIQESLNLRLEDTLLPVLFYNDSRRPIENSIKKDLSRVFGRKAFSGKQIRAAVQQAREKQQEFLSEVYSKGEEIIKKIEEKSQPIFIGIGRGYTILDSKASSSVDELFSQNGFHFLPALFLKSADYNIREIAENMYWLQGKKIINYNLSVSGRNNFFPVRETNFNCGPDSLILYHEEDIMKKANKPHLILETDGHNSNAQFGTRILAFNEVIRNSASNNLSAPQSLIKKHTSIENRIIGIPYMGDSADMLAATFKSVGIKAEVMPTRNHESIYFARKLVHTNTCQPFAFQVGDHFAWLKSLEKKGIDPNNEAAIFLPKSAGPCRFGQYSVVLRKLFYQHNYGGVPIMDPASEDNYRNNPLLSSEKMGAVNSLIFKALFANDILHNALLRSRPYETTPGYSESLYNQAHKELVAIIENNPSLNELRGFLKIQAEKYSAIEKKEQRYPLVLVNGEIFVRCHEPANQDSIKLLEKYKLEAILEPITGWINYVSSVVIRSSSDEANYHQLMKSLIKRAYMKYTEHVLFKPFSEYLKGREFHNPYDFVKLADKDMVYPSEATGEAPINIGQAYAFMQKKLDIDGIYHVSPFGCMQETVATSRIQSLRQEYRKKAQNPKDRIIPFMDAVFGESELSNLESMISLFAEQCYIRRELQKT